MNFLKIVKRLNFKITPFLYNGYSGTRADKRIPSLCKWRIFVAYISFSMKYTPLQIFLMFVCKIDWSANIENVAEIEYKYQTVAV